MPGSLLSLLSPPSFPIFLHTLYGYVFPITLHCVWSTLVLLDLAQAEQMPRGRALAWTGIVFLLPFVGSAAYLLKGRSSLSAATRLGVLAGGLLVVLVAYGWSYALIG